MQRMSGLGAVGGGGGEAGLPFPPHWRKKGEQSRNKNDFVYGTYVCAPERGGGLVAWVGGGGGMWDGGRGTRNSRKGN
jgi:hypothetical protein